MDEKTKLKILALTCLGFLVGGLIFICILWLAMGSFLDQFEPEQADVASGGFIAIFLYMAIYIFIADKFVKYTNKRIKTFQGKPYIPKEDEGVPMRTLLSLIFPLSLVLVLFSAYYGPWALDVLEGQPEIVIKTSMTVPMLLEMLILLAYIRFYEWKHRTPVTAETA